MLNGVEHEKSFITSGPGRILLHRLHEWMEGYTELQIRVGIEDNSKIIFLFPNENLCCGPSLEPSR